MRTATSLCKLEVKRMAHDQISDPGCMAYAEVTRTSWPGWIDELHPRNNDYAERTGNVTDVRLAIRSAL